ncbi:membrane protein [Shewanella mangrovi]|uniref:Membrane protein n=1 Tax=Shewanella mangrovi TaxID=1515746 RepID=A0A094JUG3_9GAMM|nr:OmpA family protein [Shewanella mangrovi]KFZ36121.1 membrane protein [Shewanella mangrovi]
MKLLLTLLPIVLLAGCSMRDTVSMDGDTQQVYNLNDEDRDGVIEAREKCSGTVTGANIDNYGCGTVKPIKERSELKVLFPNDSYYIDPQYYSQIQTIADFMKQYPHTKVTIEGHCSRTGSYDHNLELSQNRANAVTDVLNKEFGIEKDRLTAVGYSFDRPVDLSGTKEAQRRNRRVIAEVTGEDTMADMKWNIYTVDEVVK